MGLRILSKPVISFSLVACAFFVVSDLSAQQAEVPSLATVKNYVNSGEFQAALGMVHRVSDPQLRDQMLGQIATAQAQAGIGRAAIHSASEIEDDRYRTDTLLEISNPSAPTHARGGTVQPDFDALIELISSTIDPESWEELGGPGAIKSFETGVFVDSQGTLQRVTRLANNGLLTSIHQGSNIDSGNRAVAKSSPLRKVSLNRLEKAVQLRAALGKDPSSEMLNMAGLQRIRYVFIYPDTQEIVLAGPAGAWNQNVEGRTVSADNGRPILQLDDLVVILRNMKNQKGRFGCSITPYKQNLAATQAYLNQTAGKSIHPRQRPKWLAGLRDSLGKQKIEVYGIDPATRAARILVEADYHMKQIGMDIEDGTFGVPSYLETVTLSADGQAPPMDVLRWWFTLNYQSVQTTKQRSAFELRGQGVQVMSESEIIDQQGNRIHTGKSKSLNAAFARNFTKHFNALAVKYPVYNELQNIFDLALTAAIIDREGLADQIDWNMLYFGDPNGYQVTKSRIPGEVETIMNHRIINGKHIIAGVSGGVSVNTKEFFSAKSIQLDNYGLLKADHTASRPSDKRNHNNWWWD
ncbi:MAG: hypothetical protein COA78_19675 [Blastopirellula sp.]|nr:MAG: hypothetical protein COA78_19675 [Blastopirellula sp.]